MNGFDKLTTSMENKVRKGKDRLGGKKTLKVAGILEEFEKDDIKKNIDITELFQDFGVKLQKRGSPPGKSWMGLCPWHEDKTSSLSVDREKGLYNCFGCGESGDAFDLVEKMKGCDFKDALAYLKAYKPSISNVSSTSLKEETKGELQTGAGSAGFNLNTISEYYHKRLYENPKAIEYLKQRGFKIPELYERFQIGFADGSLLNIIGETQRKELIEAGILNQKEETGKVWEHFNNCLIFPIFDDNGQPVSFYGRDISEDSNPVTSTGRAFKHRYLKETHKGIWNRKASKVYADELILTECIIDALSLIELGFQNVQPIYGTNGFTDEHLQTLKDDRVKTVILALDNDPSTSSGQAGPGQKAAESIKEKLINEGFKVKILNCYGGKDWNESLVNGKLEKEELKTLISSLAVFEAEKTTESALDGLEQGLKVTQEGYSTVFKMNEIVYKVAGAKETFISSLKVNIKAQSGEERFFDTLDLYSARARSSYANQLSRLFGIEPKRVEKDLSEIVDYFEAERDRKLEDKKAPKIELTEDDKQLGLELLKSPDLFGEIVKDLDTMGYAGEGANKQLAYLAGTSRLFPKPLSVYIQSSAGSGKSALIDNTLKLMPDEIVNIITSASDQSFNYMPKEKFEGTIFAMGEALHNDKIEGDIRQMQSENMISRNVARKDQKTGEILTEAVKHKVQICFMMTSTQLKLNPENSSRCLVLNVDESREQTERVHQTQRHKRTFEGYLEDRHLVPKLVKKHITAQRMLKPQKIFNPFSSYIRFPQIKTIMRRAQEQFLTLIDAVCFIQQFKKGVIGMFDPYANEEIYGLECDLNDYGIARRLYIDGGILTNIYDVPTGVAYLYDEIRKFARKKAAKEGVKADELSFIQTDIRGLTDHSDDTVKKYIHILVEFEYLQIIGGRRHGTRFCYKLREDEPIKGLDLEIIIPSVEEMAKILEENEKFKNGKNR